MSEARRSRSRAPWPWPLIIAAVSVFCLVLGALAIRMRDGRDPALGHPTTAVVPPAPARHVLVRRVERRVVVTRVRKIIEDPPPSAPVAAGPPAPSAGSAPASTAASPPAAVPAAASTSAPRSAPAPAPAVASAPPPAPAPPAAAPVSRSS